MEAITEPLKLYPDYLGKGAAGGYLGYIALSYYQNQAMPQLISRYAIESALAGGACTYLAAMLIDVDYSSTGKAIGLGVLGYFLWNRYVRSLVQSTGVIS